MSEERSEQDKAKAKSKQQIVGQKRLFSLPGLNEQEANRAETTDRLSKETFGRSQKPEKVKPKKIEITFKLASKDIVDEIRQAGLDELAVAERKWKVRLSEEEKAQLLGLSILQLQEKVSHSFEKTTKPWQLGSDLTAKFHNSFDVEGSFIASKGKLTSSKSVQKLKKKAWLYREYTGAWSIREEANEEYPDLSVPLEESLEFIVETLKTWMRTAVFYGVGSYA